MARPIRYSNLPSSSNQPSGDRLACEQDGEQPVGSLDGLVEATVSGGPIVIEQAPVVGIASRQALLREQAQTVVVCESLEIETRGAPEFHDITADVLAIVADSGVRFGHVTIF